MAPPLAVPMTRATGLGPLPEMLEAREGAGAVCDAFRAVGIPLSVVEHRTAHVPLAAMMRLFEEAARRVGDRTFGFEVGRAMAPASFGLWMEYSAAAETLGEALLRSVHTVRFQQSVGHLGLAVEGDLAVWRYFPPDVGTPRVQHADHLVVPMLRFVRGYLGHGWRPEWIELCYSRDPRAEELEARLPAPARFGRQAVGIALRAADLAHPAARRPARTVTIAELEAGDVFAAQDEPARSLLRIVALRLLEGRSDIQGAAALAGLGVQALQRRLRRVGLTYRALVERARHARARALLVETRLPLTEIAFSLGYGDHANFTRAFRRWEGCSPSAFRRRAPAFGLVPYRLRPGLRPA